MTGKQKTAQQDPKNTSAGGSCMEMMQKMMGGQKGKSPCIDMMSQFFNPEEIDGEAIVKMIPQMMSSCCASATDSDTDTKAV
jgi:hypothetical protein